MVNLNKDLIFVLTKSIFEFLIVEMWVKNIFIFSFAQNSKKNQKMIFWSFFKKYLKLVVSYGVLNYHSRF